MIDLKYVYGFYPKELHGKPNYAKHIVKEYIQLMVLNYLSTTPYIKKLTFIGGTNLRLIKGIDRWSEDLDFDCKDMTKEEFMEMTSGVIEFLKRSGLDAMPKDKDNFKLTAFRRSIYFPQLLFDLKLTGYRDERFLLKIEMQNQGVEYKPQIVNVSGCGFFFPLPVPPDDVLLSMKLSALLTRAKGRDFYDTMFLMSQTKPDFDFLKSRSGIGNMEELKSAVSDMLDRTDLNIKKRDFEHLLFNDRNSEKILRFGEFMASQADEGDKFAGVNEIL